MTNPRPYSAPYDLRCPIARTLDIVGERWTILILRDLVTGGPRKFQDFERSLAEHAIGAIEAAGGSRDRREAVLRAAPAARRIRTDRKGQRAAPGAADLVRLGPAPHPIPPRQMSLGALDGPASISLEGGNRGTAWAQQSGALELFGISRPGRRESAGSPRATSMSTGESDSPLEGTGFEPSVPLV